MSSKKRIILIGHRYHLDKEMLGVYKAFCSTFDTQTLFVDDGWPQSIEDLPDADSALACIWFVRFRELVQRPAFQWKNYSGHRIMYDWDVHANYHTMLGDFYKGQWPKEFRRHEFSLLMTTSRLCRDLLIEDDVPAFWLPKGYDPELLFDQNKQRNGICYFGNQYRSRRAMLRYLASNRISYTTFSCKHSELNSELNRYVGCLICNMGGTVDGYMNKLIHRVFPSRGIKLEPGIEPMQKNFEVAASGCAPIADWIDELSELGFIDGENMVAYASFSELVEKLRYYEREPEELAAIGSRAGVLAGNRHTWGHRAEQLDEFLTGEVAG